MLNPILHGPDFPIPVPLRESKVEEKNKEEQKNQEEKEEILEINDDMKSLERKADQKLKLLTQSMLNDLVRDLKLSKEL